MVIDDFVQSPAKYIWKHLPFSEPFPETITQMDLSI